MMRFSAAMMVAAIFLGVACAEPPADDVGDDVVELDTVPVEVVRPPAEADAPAPEDAADADGSADAGDPPAGDTGDEAGEAGGSAEPDRETGGDAASTIPSRFHGEWNADRSACGTTTETRLRISGDRIRFYESVGQVQEVDIESDRVITVTAVYQGEGDTWEEERRLSLSEDGGSLTVSGGMDLVRYRCP